MDGEGAVGSGMGPAFGDVVDEVGAEHFDGLVADADVEAFVDVDGFFAGADFDHADIVVFGSAALDGVEEDRVLGGKAGAESVVEVEGVAVPVGFAAVDLRAVNY